MRELKVAHLASLHQQIDHRSGEGGFRSLLSAIGANHREYAAIERVRDKATRALRWRRVQRRIFPEAALRGPCWDILLCCVEGELSGRPICVKQIRAQLEESQTSVLRRIDELEQAGMVRRFRDGMDGRRTLIRLTPDGAEAMSHFFSALDEEGG
jgi:DNA repair protein RadC